MRSHSPPRPPMTKLILLPSSSSPLLLLLLTLLLLIISSQISSSDGALFRFLVKAGSNFTQQSVPGKLIVRRETKAHAEPQYLFAGNRGWTTDGDNQIGSAQLSLATGQFVVHNFSENDVGSYTFPMEPPNIVSGENLTGCAMVGPTMYILELEEK